MKLLPKTLFGQIALSLFAGLVVAQLLAMGLLLNDRGQLNYKLLAEYAAQRMAGIAAVLDSAEPAERPALVKALSVLPTTVSLSLPWVSGREDDSMDARLFAQVAAHHLARPLQIQMLSIERLDPLMFALHPRSATERRQRDGDAGDGELGAIRGRLLPRNFVAQIRLSDGSVLSFHHVLPLPSTDLPYRVLALLGLLGVSVAGLTIWSVRRLTRPLANLAEAAAGLARNLDQAPLAERGPQEVQQAAQAFNAMQRELKRIIDTRAQALAAVSHDLRLPITRMRLRLESEMSASLKEKIEQDLMEMDSMIGHTLDFLRAGSPSEATVMVNLDALLDSLVEDMEELGAQIERRGRCTQALAGRPHALRRCIANLLDNARLYGGGQIRVSVLEAPEAVQVLIEDRGPGIPAAARDKVFDPYFRLEASRARHTGGTGLGLPIARAIAQSHGGSIELDEAEGGGLRVTLRLPRQVL
jgi:signal transduction histidine kinase